MSGDSRISFNISGSALSFLYYECDKSRTDQIGFLIGERNSFVTKTISDSEQHGEKSETVISISAILPVGPPFEFCNNFGKIDVAKLKENLGPFREKLCGWYLFRRNTRVNPLLVGTVLHKELLLALNEMDCQSFPLCCIGSDFDCQEDASNATIQLKHVFLLFLDGLFRPISVPVINLGQPEDCAYRTEALSAVANPSFLEVINSIKNKKDISGLQFLKALQQPLQDKIVKLACDVQWAEKRSIKVTRDIESIHEQRTKEEDNQQLDCGEPSMLLNETRNVDSPTSRTDNLEDQIEGVSEEIRPEEDKEVDEDDEDDGQGEGVEGASNEGGWIAKKRKRRKGRKYGQPLPLPTAPV